MQSSNSGDDRPECEDTTERESQHKNDAQKEKESRGNDIETRVQRRGNGEGRWEPSFLQEELREMCLQQLEIPVNATLQRIAGRSYTAVSRSVASDQREQLVAPTPPRCS